MLALTTLLFEGPVRAGEDLEEVRELQEQGEIRSLEVILDQAQKRVPEGRLVEVELHRAGPKLLYEVEFIDSRGRLQELYFDARDGTHIPGKPVEEGQEHH